MASALRKKTLAAVVRPCPLSAAILLRHTQVALMFLVRHEAYHGAVWTKWLESVEGLIPVAAAHDACCRGRAGRRLSLQPSAVRGFSLNIKWAGCGHCEHHPSYPRITLHDDAT